MTREERGLAIGFFELRRRIFCDNHLKNCPKNSNEYIATLIEKTFYDMAIKSLEKESCEDAVSRQAVKEQMIYYGFLAPDMTVTEFVEDCLPSVNPQKPKTDVLDKLKDEIEQLPTTKCTKTRRTYIDADNFKKNVIEIIDKYRAESEV